MALAKDLFFVFLCHLLLLKAVSKCPEAFQCGNHFPLEFPFTDVNDPGCGLFVVDGCDSGYPTIHLGGARGFGYTILEKKSTNKFLISDPQPQIQLTNRSCFSFTNVSLPQSPFVSFTFSPNLTFFTCLNELPNEQMEAHFQSYNRKDCGFSTVYYKTPANDVPATGESNVPPGCTVIQLPIKSNQDSGNKRSKIILLAGGVVTAFICTSIVLLLSIWKKHTILKLLGHQSESANEKDIELFLKNNGNLAPRRYKYSEVKRMTNSFIENLGKGGYGSVYKGKLPDGCLVAVKILNETEGNGEEFMNEVASISRTSHINIVTLLGFCFEGSKRALIYQFMHNGSLENFIQNTASSPAEGGLGWQKLFEIALGIARGLEYLHQGCKTRILHFDIKPHNILLDKDFNPRISDFGLAKLCPNRSSIVSMLVARGTIGYIAPEVFCRNFGEVSHKSDVYSYGMMVLEIAGGIKKTDRRDVDHTSEIYFPHYIYKQLEMDAERDGSLFEIMNENESQSAKRKLIIVGLWCIQTDPRDRPSMTKVVEMLEGKLESLRVPPRPYLHSPPRTVSKFSTSESI